MSGDLVASNGGKSRWLPLWLMLGVPLAVGLYLGFNYSRDRTVGFWIELVLGIAMAGAGIFMLIDARHLPARRLRRSAGAVGVIVLGVAFASPPGGVKTTLMAVAMLLFLPVLLDIPRRLFRPRPS
jgi:peptidoglycan/LPS O-acetylase OafA/YrhL